ncbi:hypothetical protein K435DRAFT_858335 [Dendrothele bispora CBS 962.96]|uniref:Uncharacterized protein n=1 Tax=Dendrothele bispora (strain CBS 962.96) TaxID=1314807 RepID=A0A4S8M4G4_DENBC|nr:hypothetical protein K435DRAFT_858335 [Dendrothele bispora CBS 962.96]
MANSKSTKVSKTSNSTSSTQNLNQNDTVQLSGCSVEHTVPAPKTKGSKKDPPVPIQEQEDQSSHAAITAQLATIAEQAAASAKKRHLHVNATSKPKPSNVFHNTLDDFGQTYYPVDEPFLQF